MKHRPFNWSFILGNTEIAGGQARWVGRVGNSGHVIFCQEFPQTSKVCASALSWCNNQPLFFHVSDRLDLTFSLSHLKTCSKTSHWQSDQVEQTPYVQFLERKKKMISNDLVHSFQSRRGWRLPLRRLLDRKLGSCLTTFCSSVHTWTWWSRWSLFKRWGTNFAAIRLMFSSSTRMCWHDLYDSPMWLQTSWIVCLLG